VSSWRVLYPQQPPDPRGRLLCILPRRVACRRPSDGFRTAGAYFLAWTPAGSCGLSAYATAFSGVIARPSAHDDAKTPRPMSPAPQMVQPKTPKEQPGRRTKYETKTDQSDIFNHKLLKFFHHIAGEQKGVWYSLLCRALGLSRESPRL
jgi:hypothetical protein